MGSKATKTAVLVLALTLAALALPQPAAATTGSWIVTLKPTVDPESQAAGIAATVSATVGHVFSHVLRGFSFTGTDLQASALAADPAVASVVPDGAVHLQEGAQVTPTGLARIGAPVPGHTGAGVTVAVIDSGIDLLHPDLLANIHPTLGANCRAPAAPPLDDVGHGTHVAGTIAAVDNLVGVIGVAPAAKLVPVKSFDATDTQTWADVICGINYVASHASEIDVVNMSFGDVSTEATSCDGVTTSDIDALRQSICDLTAAGVVAVAASGNNGIDVTGFVPAAFPETIAVSSYSDTDGAPGGLGGCLLDAPTICDDSFTSLFSNYGPRIDVTAPGWAILSTKPGGTYGIEQGTSMAAPHVSGVAALLLQADPTMSVEDVRAALRRTGECPDGSTAGIDGTCAGQGSWYLDRDPVAEPLLRAYDAPPAVGITSPSGTVAGTVTVASSANDDHTPTGALAVDIRIDAGPWQAATWNASTGSYERAWDTRSASNGTHAITSRATDVAGQVTTSSPVTVTVLNDMHVGDLDGSAALVRKGWKATVTVTVHSRTEAIVSGAVVTVSWSGGTGSCTTNKKGTCAVSTGTIALTQPSVTLTVASVTKSGQTYTPPINHDPDGDSNGTTISVTR